MKYSYYFPEYRTGCYGFDTLQLARVEASLTDLHKNGAYFLIGKGEYKPKTGFKEIEFDSRTNS